MKADTYLKNKEIDFNLIEQDKPTKDCDDAAKARGVNTNQIVKSLIIERNLVKGKKQDANLFHVLIPGDREVSERKFGENRLIPPEKSKELTGFESGAVHPFSTNIKHLIDFRLIENSKLSFTTGDTQKGVVIDKEDFIEALDLAGFNYKIQDIVTTNDSDIQRLEKEGFNKNAAKFISKKGLEPFIQDFSDIDSMKLFKVLKEFEREEMDYDKEDIEQVIDSMENENHMKKMVGNLRKNGELKDEEDFELDVVIDNVLSEFTDAAEDLENGKESTMNFLIGKIMQRTNGRAEPSQISNKINKVLK